jgi:5-methylcytosine-specific restriction endonuclease McrA
MVVYKQYLRSPEWRRKRVAVILRAKGRCELCGIGPATNIHHITYRNLGNEPLDDLQGVCLRCHKESHYG